MKTVLTALLLLSSVGALGQLTSQPAPPGKLIDLGGYRLHLNCTGNKGPTVVLIAGAGDFSFDWSLVQPNIAQFARVCSYDRAGFAWSDPGPIPRTMKQEAFELHTMLRAAHIKGPYILVGHSIGGLVTRVYARQYSQEVAGILLIDSLHEDTTLSMNGKLAHMRELAKPDPVPAAQTIKSAPPKPVTKEVLDEFQSNLKSNPPKIGATFNKLPESIQAMRLWFLSQPPRGGGMDFLAEELRDIYNSRAKSPYQLGNLPLLILLPKTYGKPPRGVDADEWKRFNEEKRQAEDGFHQSLTQQQVDLR
jgi:pimeloyl-ACP methyl ester carboxylesterase